jgi:hypothetical protein
MNGSWTWSSIVLVAFLVAIFLITRFYNKNGKVQRAEEMAEEAAKDCGLEERTAILNQAILEYVNLGWRVISQTPTTAQLVRDKHANGCLAFILFFLLIVPCILYLLLYKGAESCYLEVNIKGRVIYHYAE